MNSQCKKHLTEAMERIIQSLSSTDGKRHMAELRAFVLGISTTILADRIFDVEIFTWPALAVAVICLIAGGVKYGRRLHS